MSYLDGFPGIYQGNILFKMIPVGQFEDTIQIYPGIVSGLKIVSLVETLIFPAVEW